MEEPFPGYKENKTYLFYGVDGNCFKLDNQIYEVIEDENDGYRSALGSVELKNNEISDKIFFNTPLAEVKIVDCEKQSNSEPIKGWAIIDIKNNHMWLQYGTRDWEDWYPYFVFKYEPCEKSSYIPPTYTTKKSRFQLLKI
jgi:hypothetical protein